MTTRRVTREECTITVEASEEEYAPESSVYAYDDGVVASFREMINEYGLWGWCSVKVTVTWTYTNPYDMPSTLTGEGYLGECSYKSEDDFRASSGYFDDMVDDALDDLNDHILHLLANASCIEKALSE